MLVTNTMSRQFNCQTLLNFGLGRDVVDDRVDPYRNNVSVSQVGEPEFPPLEGRYLSAPPLRRTPKGADEPEDSSPKGT